MIDASCSAARFGKLSSGTPGPRTSAVAPSAQGSRRPVPRVNVQFERACVQHAIFRRQTVPALDHHDARPDRPVRVDDANGFSRCARGEDAIGRVVGARDGHLVQGARFCQVSGSQHRRGDVWQGNAVARNNCLWGNSMSDPRDFCFGQGPQKSEKGTSPQRSPPKTPRETLESFRSASKPGHPPPGPLPAGPAAVDRTRCRKSPKLHTSTPSVVRTIRAIAASGTPFENNT